MPPLRVAQVVPRIEDEASGPSYSVPMLCEALAARHDSSVQLFVLDDAPRARRSYAVRAFPSWRFPRRLGISPGMRGALRAAAAHCDVMHGNGLWMMPNVYPGGATRGSRCRLVVSPRGTLSRWALGRSRLAKRLVWNAGQRAALAAADCFHATAEHEYEDIRRLGFTAPVAVVPNGIDVPPDRAAGREERAVIGESAGARRRLLFLGRVHPTKGVDVLLRAWRDVQARFGDWELRIVGPGAACYLAELARLSESLGCRRVEFTGPAYGASKVDEYLQAELFVLPSHSENFGVAVAEALVHAVPVISTKGTPWSGLVANRCGWWIDDGVGPLAQCLADAMARPGRVLRELGGAGRRWAAREFSWDVVGQSMHDTYRWLLGEADRPVWVRTD